MLTGWDSNKKVRIRPGKQLIPSALADITLPVHLNSSSGVCGKDMSAMFSDLNPVDPYWDNVVLAMPMDGADGSTTFTDLKGKTVTRYGNTVISTAQSKFGGSSAYFDGSYDYLEIGNANDFQFGSGDFTIRGYIYPLSSPGSGVWRGVLGQKTNNTTAFSWHLVWGQNNGSLYFDWSTTGTSASGTVIVAYSLALNQWHHVAIVRSGNTISGFLNGVLTNSASIGTSTLYSSSVNPVIGNYEASNPNSWHGYVCDLEVTKGVAQYTADFTPPTRSIATTSPTYSGLNPLAKKIALEIGDTGVEVPISILTQDWDNVDNTAEAAKIYAVFEDLEDGNDFTLYWDSTHADNTNVTEISSAPAAPGSGDALTVWNLASTDDLWLIATEFYTISGTVTVSAVAASRRVVVFDESRIYQSFFSDASDGSYSCFVPSTGPFNIAMIGNAGEYPKIFSGVTAG